MLTDADFADDVALLADKIGNAEKLLNCSKYWRDNHSSKLLWSRTGERFQLSR